MLIAVARAVLVTTLGASTGYLRGRRVKELADLQAALEALYRCPVVTSSGHLLINHCDKHNVAWGAGEHEGCGLCTDEAHDG